MLIKILITALFSFNLYASLVSIEMPQDEVYLIAKSAKVQDKQTVESELMEILNDPDKLVSDHFNIPRKLFSRVSFWAKVYALYPSTTVVIHDMNDLSIVYKVLDFNKTKTHRKSGKRLNRYTRYWRFRTKIANEKKRVRTILTNLSKRKSFRGLSRAERKIYKIWRKSL